MLTFKQLNANANYREHIQRADRDDIHVIATERDPISRVRTAFTVRGSTGKEYRVTKDGTCTCYRGEKGLFCKHAAAVLRFQATSDEATMLREIEEAQKEAAAEIVLRQPNQAKHLFRS